VHQDAIRQEFTHQASSFGISPAMTSAETLGALVEMVPDDPNGSWLEMACGPGLISRAMSGKVGSVVGLDLTEAMLAEAKRKAREEGIQNVSFVLGDAASVDFEDASFDGAITRFSFHHIPAPWRVMGEMARVVRLGGWVVVSDFIADPDRDVYAAVEEIERLRDPSHWSCLTAAQLRAIGDPFGLELESERLVPFDLDYDDWLRRGSGGAAAGALIDELLERLPSGSGCFRVYEAESGRRLALVNSLTRWRRP
jgi:SAM-dependent methyltransferase